MVTPVFSEKISSYIFRDDIERRVYVLSCPTESLDGHQKTNSRRSTQAKGRQLMATIRNHVT